MSNTPFLATDANAKVGPGFESLWQFIGPPATRTLRSSYPFDLLEQLQRIEEAKDVKWFVQSHGIAVAVPHLELLELAVAFVHTGQRLGLILRATKQLNAATPPAAASLVLEEIWPTLIQAHAEAAKKLALRCMSKTVGENSETSRFRVRVSERLTAVKESNNNLRHPVVHGDIHLAKAVKEDGLWPTLVSQDPTAEDFLEAMDLWTSYDARTRDRREQVFRSMTLLTLAETDAWLADCSALIKRHTKSATPNE